MNTDDFIVMDYGDGLSKDQIKDIRLLLPKVEEDRFDGFIKSLNYRFNVYRASELSHSTIPDARDQNRFLRKLEGKLSRLGVQAADVSMLLDDAPFSLRRQATKAKVPLSDLQSMLTVVVQALNDVEPQKAKYRPEALELVRWLFQAYEEVLGVSPTIRAYREDWDVPDDMTTEGSFVPVLAKVMRVSVDHAYRLAKKVSS